MDWQAIETAPKDGTRVIVGWYQSPHVAVGRSDGEEWRDDSAHLMVPPTHWMPLPDPPFAGGEP